MNADELRDASMLDLFRLEVETQAQVMSSGLPPFCQQWNCRIFYRKMKSAGGGTSSASPCGITRVSGDLLHHDFRLTSP